VTPVDQRPTGAFRHARVYEFLEVERIKYVIRLPTNQILQHRIGHLLKRPVGRPPNEVRRFYANFTYKAGSWTHPRRVIAKVEWHKCHRFLQQTRPCEQCIKEGKGAINGRGCHVGRSPRPRPRRYGQGQPQPR
jgi:hypothetical protein